MNQFWIISFQGVYLGGYMLVWAKDAAEACELARNRAARDGMHRPIESFEAKPLEFDWTGTMMIWNGDY